MCTVIMCSRGLKSITGQEKARYVLNRMDAWETPVKIKVINVAKARLAAKKLYKLS